MNQEKQAEQREPAGETHSTAEFLMRRMRHKGDLPAFSEHIVEINSKLSSLTAITLTSASELSKIILKDYALTNKLLQVVNSALYATISGKVATVSKAVLLLGFDKMRMIAVALMVFEHLQNKSQAAELKESAIASLTSATIAMDLAENMKLGGSEEVFICAMLHNLGRMLAICYLPEEHAEVKKRMAAKGLDETMASRSVLGITYTDMGMAVSRSWNFPDKIVRSMEAPPAGVITQPRNETETLRNLSSYSNDLLDCIINNEDDQRTAALSDLSIRYQNSVPMPVEQIETLIDAAVTNVDTYSAIVRIDKKNSPLMQKLFRSSRGSGKDPEKGKTEDEVALKANQTIDAKTGSRSPGRTKKEQATILADGLGDITDAMGESYNLGDVIYMILETMYRGFDFSHTIFCLMDPAKSIMTMRFGIGENTDEIANRFHFRVGHSGDIFNVAISQAKGIIIDDAAAPNIVRNIPEWYRTLIGAPSFLIYPLVVKGGCIGMLYADRKEKGRLLTANQINDMEKLRDMAIEAITKKH